MWLDTRDTPSQDRNPPNFTAGWWHTLNQACDSTSVRELTYVYIVSNGICHPTTKRLVVCLGFMAYQPSHQTGKCDTRSFLRWVQTQGRSPDTLGIPKNDSGPVGIPLKKGGEAPGD